MLRRPRGGAERAEAAGVLYIGPHLRRDDSSRASSIGQGRRALKRTAPRPGRTSSASYGIKVFLQLNGGVPKGWRKDDRRLKEVPG